MIVLKGATGVLRLHFSIFLSQFLQSLSRALANMPALQSAQQSVDHSRPHVWQLNFE